MDLRAALDAVRSAPSILEAMRRADGLTAAAAASSDADASSLLRGVVEDADSLTAIAALHALGAVDGAAADRALTSLLEDARPHLAEHAVDTLSGRAPVPDAVPALVRATSAGGFAGMLAQRTLEAWAATVPDVVGGALLESLTRTHGGPERARLVETLGLVPGLVATIALLDVVRDEQQPFAVRATAVAALGDRPVDPVVLDTLASIAAVQGPLSATARLALHDLRSPVGSGGSTGATIAQLYMHCEIDGRLRHSGQGDTGGIATLLVHLGDALLRQSRVDRVITVSGGRADGPRELGRAWGPGSGAEHAARPEGGLARELAGRGHHYATVPFLDRPTGAERAWPRRVAARRGIRRILRAAGRVDVLHLRMADVGSMAAAEAARELGVPVVLTLAPDPQALIDARDAAGTLTRASFGVADHTEHLWFRDRLLRHLAAQAEHLVLFPRPEVEADMQRYLGLDVGTCRERVSVIGEGVDVSALVRVAREVRGVEPRGAATAAALADLEDLLGALPAGRRGLPLAVSVGRLAAVKGMANLVSAWAGDARLRDRCNLVVVGGDLEDPTEQEAAELAGIHAAVPAGVAAQRGLILAGHRPNATTTTWLAAVRHGKAGLAAPAGVYVCASLKEEFGIAILEAMAVGLVVVAPAGGGPATYVVDGGTGILTDTSDADTLAAATHAALDLAASPEAEVLALRARDTVRAGFGIDSMAAALVGVYDHVSADRAPAPSASGSADVAS